MMRPWAASRLVLLWVAASSENIRRETDAPFSERRVAIFSNALVYTLASIAPSDIASLVVAEANVKTFAFPAASANVVEPSDVPFVAPVVSIVNADNNCDWLMLTFTVPSALVTIDFLLVLSEPNATPVPNKLTPLNFVLAMSLNCSCRFANSEL